MAWIKAITNCSFAELQSEKEELEKKYIHIMQILESEKTAKWQLLQQCEEQGQLVSSLKAEVAALRKQKAAEAREEESEEIRNIKKRNNSLSASNIPQRASDPHGELAYLGFR